MNVGSIVVVALGIVALVVSIALYAAIAHDEHQGDK